MADEETLSKNQTLAIMTAALLGPNLLQQLKANEDFGTLLSDAMGYAREIYKQVVETNK